MPYQMDVNTTSGITVEEAYHILDFFSGNTQTVQFGINVYASKENFEQGYEPVLQQIYSFTPEFEEYSPNLVKQIYAYLRTLPEYSTALEVP